VGGELFYFVYLSGNDGIQRRSNLLFLWGNESALVYFCLENGSGDQRENIGSHGRFVAEKEIDPVYFKISRRRNPPVR